MSLTIYKKPKDVTKQYGFTSATLRSWAIEGKIKYITTPNNYRLYDIDSIRSFIGDSNTTSGNKYIYARVSSAKQKEDLQRQIKELQEAYPGHNIIKDIGSGINFKRQGLCSLLERLHQGMVSEVVVMHRDRLARFAFDLLEFIFKQKGCRLVVHRQGKGAESTEQLAEDLMAITTVFVATHHGKRAAENRKRRKSSQEKEKEGEISSKKRAPSDSDPEDSSIPELGGESDSE
jgi:predicted site-specific integrase-resolvase